MSNSVREQIVQAMKSIVEDAVTFPVYRSRGQALAKSATEAVLVNWINDNPSNIGYERSDSVLRVGVAMFSKRPDAEEYADEHLVTIHNALMADRLLGGLCNDIYISGATNQHDEFEQEVCVITHVYNVAFRFQSLDITSP